MQGLKGQGTSKAGFREKRAKTGRRQMNRFGGQAGYAIVYATARVYMEVVELR